MELLFHKSMACSLRSPPRWRLEARREAMSADHGDAEVSLRPTRSNLDICRAEAQNARGGSHAYKRPAR